MDPQLSQRAETPVCDGSDMQLVLLDLERRFGRRHVFSEISATVNRGEVLTIAGSNGSGKSTLLRIIAGLLNPTRGRVYLCENKRALDDVAHRARVGYVAPDFALYARLTGTENLRFLATLYGVEQPDLEGHLTRVGLGGRGGDPVSSYSSGMRQRLKYAAALLHNPTLLILDEPTANLDEEGGAMVQDVIAAQRASGVTGMATNEASEVTWGDRVIRLGA
jgi:heme exporter protein A